VLTVSVNYLLSLACLLQLAGHRIAVLADSPLLIPFHADHFTQQGAAFFSKRRTAPTLLLGTPNATFGVLGMKRT
jgi:hypothetical protein